jgi:pimeloyl-ACP methyl ester carboxylesterase
MLPLIILHGWSDDSGSFKKLAGWLRQSGFDVVDVYLGDYLSMNDEITLFDLGAAFSRALTEKQIPQTAGSFDVIVHSTGALVAREYQRQVCRGDPTAAPIKHLCMMGPANFGSPLAKLGKSMLGRLIKGWGWDHLGQTGQHILNALELASPYSWELAEADLFDPKFNVMDPANTMTTVLVGTAAYASIFRSTLHENGSDGTVRVSTANLNANYFDLDLADPDKPKLTRRPRNVSNIAFAVFNRDHSTIHEPDTAEQEKIWKETVIRALTIAPSAYASHVKACRATTDKTFADGLKGRHKEWFHQYEHVVFRVRDQFGHPVSDYMVEFYQQDDDPRDKIFRKIHGEILEKVTKNSVDESLRSFLFDITDLVNYLKKDDEADIEMSFSAAHLSSRILFRNPRTGIKVFTTKNQQFLLPNEPVLINVTLYRDQSSEVFRLTPVA